MGAPVTILHPHVCPRLIYGSTNDMRNRAPFLADAALSDRSTLRGVAGGVGTMLHALVSEALVKRPLADMGGRPAGSVCRSPYL